MVERVAGSAEAKLLAAQALNDIKRLVCLKADDDTYIVKPGYRAS
ncbi:unnamed protein product, partial [Rotaria magnacalcarata]